LWHMLHAVLEEIVRQDATPEWFVNCETSSEPFVNCETSSEPIVSITFVSICEQLPATPERFVNVQRLRSCLNCEADSESFVITLQLFRSTL
jgi:hypothetical protein